MLKLKVQKFGNLMQIGDSLKKLKKKKKKNPDAEKHGGHEEKAATEDEIFR